MTNTEHLEIHLKLKEDRSYNYSIENNDPLNMQMVLRAYDIRHGLFDAMDQVDWVLRTFNH